MIGGQVVYHKGQFKRLDREAIVNELAASLNKPLSKYDKRMADLSGMVYPYVADFYGSYIKSFRPGAVQALYAMNSR